MKDIRFRFSKRQDLKALMGLLEDCGLPSEDIGVHLKHVLLAERNGSMIGCIGLEVLGETGLMRSLAVRPYYRGQGLGKALYRRMLIHAHERGIQSWYLLTTTAEGFFRKLGFRKLDRRKVPAAVRQTKEFQTLCPATAQCLTQKLTGLTRYYPRDALGLRPDVLGAAMWGVALEKTMLTYFTVKPNCRFDKHTHESEQITFVLKGSLFFEIENGEVIEIKEGEVIAIPSHIAHAVFTGRKKTVAVDAWSPVMEKYKKYSLKRGS